MAKKPLLIQLEDRDKEKIKRLASEWGLSLAGTIRRLIWEYDE